MNNGIVIVAHAPLASALRQGVAHVFPERMAGMIAFDVQPDMPVQQSLEALRQAVAQVSGAPLLVLTDVVGGTPCNLARQMLAGVSGRLVAGVNLPMLLRAVTYQNEPIDELLARALSGGVQGIVQLSLNAEERRGKQA
jgi:PTS system ascorbate-specific IIA component